MKRILMSVGILILCVVGSWGIQFSESKAVAENATEASEPTSTENQTLLAFQGSGYRPGSGIQPGSGSGHIPMGIPVQPKSYESQLWDWLNRAQYHNWAAAPGQKDAAYPGQSPHGAFLKMYLNRKASTDIKNLPHGSVIIKENFGKDGKTLMAVTIMFRTKGYDPKHNDWYWVKYNANGTVARTPPEKGNMKIAGKFSKCIECHSSAEGDDFVFFNDTGK